MCRKLDQARSGQGWDGARGYGVVCSTGEPLCRGAECVVCEEASRCPFVW